MHVHILGICGTFMGSLALIAKQLGHKVSGSDVNVYPPMSTQLSAAGIELREGFDDSPLEDKPDLVVVGNIVSRGNPCMEAVLNRGFAYTSGPQWLAEHVLRDKWVLAVAGTHGKTTTTSMLAWVLEYCGMSPGFLIGGVPENFPVSARLGESDFFVIEADEYDTAFFDKRSKFVHYRPRTLVLNNLEFDHADIFPDLDAIKTQFHHLLRMVPQNGLVLFPQSEKNIHNVIEMGAWTPVQTIGEGGDWQYCLNEQGFDCSFNGENHSVRWSLAGEHNVLNAMAAIAAARHVGVSPAHACEALCEFRGVKRRMQLLQDAHNIEIYDDFAHHPTAIKTTLEGLRRSVGAAPILAIIELRSNTMKSGYHRESLADSVAEADKSFWMQAQSSDEDWNISDYVDGSRATVFSQVDAIVNATLQLIDKGWRIVIMSNGGFDGLHATLCRAIEEKFS